MSRGLRQSVQDEVVSHLDLGLYVTAEEELPVRQALERMRRCRCGAALVIRGEELRGIFTERDVLRKVVHRPETWERPVAEFMTADPACIPAGSAALDAARLMNRGHFRNIPVLDAAGTLHGNLTDHALVHHLCDQLQAEVLNLPPVPGQIPDTVEGA